MTSAALSPEVVASASTEAGPRAPFVTLQTGETCWLVNAALADEFLTATGLRATEWERQGRVEVVKTGPHRTVSRLDLPAGEFYLKEFRIADWKAVLQNVVRPCKAEREGRAARRVAELGLPTFETVALGRTYRDGIVRESYLITRGIPQALPLDQFLQTVFATLPFARQARIRQQLAMDLGRLTARLHLAAIDHVDFHAGNILVRINAGDVPELWLIDLHAVRFRRELSRRQRERNLALLHQFFVRRATRTDRLRFFQAYESARETVAGQPFQADSIEDRPRGQHSCQAGKPDLRKRIRQLEAYLHDAAHRGWRRADRAWRRGNRHVRKLDEGTTRCRGVATLAADWLCGIRDAPEQLFSERLLHWCKRSGRHRVAAVKLPAKEGEIHAFWKCIEERGRFRRLIGRLRDSTVRHAWETGHAFLRRGIDTPRPLMYVETSTGPVSRQYLLTEAVPDSATLRDLLTSFRPITTVEERRRMRSLSGQLAHQLRRLHDCGFDHRDLKFSNILVATDSQNVRTWILDLDAVQVWQRLPIARAVQNLSRLNVSGLQTRALRNTDRLRFLLSYLQGRQEPRGTGPQEPGRVCPAEWKWWWRAIARRSRQKAEQNRRRGRPLT